LNQYINLLISYHPSPIKGDWIGILTYLGTNPPVIDFLARISGVQGPNRDSLEELFGKVKKLGAHCQQLPSGGTTSLHLHIVDGNSPRYRGVTTSSWEGKCIIPTCTKCVSVGTHSPCLNSYLCSTLCNPTLCVITGAILQCLRTLLQLLIFH